MPVNVVSEVAQNAREIVPRTFWVVSAILRQELDWRAKGLPRHIAINVSARLLQDAGFVREMNNLLASSAGYFHFEFEITETALMSSQERAIYPAGELLNTGGTLAIDDFGTGYSSLAYLKGLQASVLKIDRSFISQLGSPGESRAIVETILNLASSLGIGVVAEGIETADQVDRLRQMQCPHGQGFWFSRPLTPTAAEELIASAPTG
mgnify:CR=1 FL=1